MTNRFLLLLPSLTLLACDSAPAQTADTDDGMEASSTGAVGDTETVGAPDTTGVNPDPDPDTTMGEDTTGGETADDTTDGETTDDTTGGETADDTTAGETTGPDETDGATSSSTGSLDPFCGDGNTDPGEACDDGDDNGRYDACDAECQGPGPSCGDRNTDAPDESCDDGEQNGEYEQCASDCSGPGASCGDGNTDPGFEACDDGAQNGSYGSCAADCAGPAAFCGDGNTDAGFESCDDGDNINGNGCNNDCVPSGDLLFEVTKTTIGTSSSDRGEAIAVRDDGMVLVGQRSLLNDDLQQVMVVEFEPDGAFVSEQIHQNNSPSTRTISVRSLQAGGEYLVVDRPVGLSSDPTLVVAYSPTHEQDWLLSVQSQRALELRPGGGSVGIYAPPSESNFFRFRDSDAALSFESDQNAAYFYSNVMPFDEASATFINFVDLGGGLQPALSRIDDAGVVITQTTYADIDIDFWDNAELHVGTSGRTAVASDGGAFDEDAYVALFEADGSRAWEITYDSPDGGRIVVRDVAVDSAGAVIVVGSIAETTFPFQQDGLVLKFGDDGDLLWRREFAGTAGESESLTGVAVAADDSIYVTGSMVNIAGAPDVLLAHFTP